MTNTKKSPRGRPRAFDPGAAAAVAARLFHERGYDALGVAELAAATGINPPSLYAAFGSKAGLFREAIGCYAAGAGAALYEGLEGGGPLAGRLRDLLLRAAQSYTDPARPPGCMVMAALGTTSDPEARAAAAAIGAEAAGRLRAAIAAERPDLADPLTADLAVALGGLSAAARDGLPRAALVHAAETIAAGLAARLSAPAALP